MLYFFKTQYGTYTRDSIGKASSDVVRGGERNLAFGKLFLAWLVLCWMNYKTFATLKLKP